MDRDQAKAITKARNLITKATKEKSDTQLKLLLPVLLEWLQVVTEDKSHSKWYWMDIEQKMEKDYAKERYIVPQVVEGINEVPAERGSQETSKEKTQANELENSSSNSKPKSAKRVSGKRKKNV